MAKITVEQLWPGNQAPGEWKVIGHATTLNGAARIARTHYDPQGFGGFRHPDGGPKYGTIRAIDGENILHWDGAIGNWLE